MKQSKFSKENQVIQQLGRELIIMCEKDFKAHRINSQHKESIHDVVVQLDKQFNTVIIERLMNEFNNRILSEETSPNIDLRHGRSWVVDPLCGSRNASSGIKLFCSNIVLVENNKPLAAWVFDYLGKQIIWGAIDSQLFSNGQELSRLGQPSTGVQRINIDWGHYFELERIELQKYASFVQDLIISQKTQILALDSSLGLTYVATGQIQAAIIVNTYPWDFLAAAFLVEQNGGFVSNADGTAWNIGSKNLIMSGNFEIHQLLLDIAKKNKLQTIKRRL